MTLQTICLGSASAGSSQCFEIYERYLQKYKSLYMRKTKDMNVNTHENERQYLATKIMRTKQSRCSEI